MSEEFVDLGETFFSDTYEIRDTNGNLANAGTLTATITLPDLTTASPPVNNPGTGQYNFNYLTTQLGHHQIEFTAQGGTLGTFIKKVTDSFEVELVAEGIVSLNRVKSHLNIPAATTTHNEELRGYMRAATEVVESHCGPIIRQSYTDNVTGGSNVVVLHRGQVLTLTSVTPVLTSAPSVTLADLDVSDNGIMYHKTGSAISAGPLRVTYVAGRAIIPAGLRTAALIIIKYLWETQRGPGQVTEGITTPVPFEFEIPPKARVLINNHAAPPGAA